ncbi:MAG: two-component system response regulator CreB [Methylococcaceae bacterium]|nr:two-component system response regulator CreB [Methylococcaceae bacterium]
MSKILIIDDEPSIVDNITFALQTEGFTTVSYTTGGNGFNAFKTERFDLIILDIGLPDMNGFDLAKQIRSSSQIPIIFLTARSTEIDRVVGLELGADDYVTKPFSPRELSARVKAILRRAGFNHRQETQQQNSNFVVNDEKKQISYHNQRIELSRTEYRLLNILLKSPGRVYSRNQLMDYAWEHSGVSLDRTVDTHIKTIRQKLKVIFPEYDPIVTHRGIGYALREDK